MFIPTTSRSFGPNLPEAIEFWESKDPQEIYQYSNAHVCACGQYSSAIDDKQWRSFGSQVNETQKFWHRLNTLAGEGDHTFGALVERAKVYADC